MLTLTLLMLPTDVFKKWSTPSAPKFCPFATPTSLHFLRFSTSQQNRLLVFRPAPYRPLLCLEGCSPEKRSPAGNWHLAAQHTARQLNSLTA